MDVETQYCARCTIVLIGAFVGSAAPKPDIKASPSSTTDTGMYRIGILYPSIPPTPGTPQVAQQAHSNKSKISKRHARHLYTMSGWSTSLTQRYHYVSPCNNCFVRKWTWFERLVRSSENARSDWPSPLTMSTPLFRLNLCRESDSRATKAVQMYTDGDQ